MQPFTKTLETEVAAAAANADASGAYVKAPFAGVVTSVSIIPAADLTGADTESRTVQVFNRGADGSGTTKVAELAFEEGTDAAEDAELAITLSAVEGALDVAEGDVLEVVSLHVGSTGLAGPAFTAYVEFSRSSAEA